MRSENCTSSMRRVAGMVSATSTPAMVAWMPDLSMNTQATMPTSP